MPLAGDLSAVGLADLFQMLAMGRKEGTLTVEDAASKRQIYFAGDSVRMLSTGMRRGLRIGEVLLRQGKITPAQIQAALKEQEESGGKLGSILLARGWIKEDDIAACVRSQIEEEIYDLFLWRDAKFDFAEGPPPAEEGDPLATQLQFDVQGLLMEALRRSDEWQRIQQKIPGIDSVFRFGSPEVQSSAAAKESEAGREALQLLDGATSIKDVVESTGIPRFDVCRTVLGAVDRGDLAEVPAKDVAEAGKAAEQAGAKDKARRLYRAAVGRAGAEVDVEWVGRLASLLEEVDKTQAIRWWAYLAKIARERGDGEAHERSLVRWRTIAPEDLEAARQLFELLVQSQRRPEAGEVGLAAVRAALDKNDNDSALAIGHKLVILDPKSLAYRVHLLRVLHRLGASQEAHEELRMLVKNLRPWEQESQEIEREMRELFPDFFLTALPVVMPKRDRRIWIAAAAAFVLLGAGGGVAWRLWGGDDNGPTPTPTPPTPPGPRTARDWMIVIDRQLAAGDFDGAFTALAELERLSPGDAPSYRSKVESERQSAELVAQIPVRLAAADYRAAAAITRRVLNDFSRTRAAQSVKIPLHIRSEPPGAQVLEGRIPLGETPRVFEFDPTRTSVTLVFERAGYRRASRTLTEQELFAGEFFFTLPDRVAGFGEGGVSLRGVAVGPPVPIRGDDMLIPFADGLSRYSLDGRMLSNVPWEGAFEGDLRAASGRFALARVGGAAVLFGLAAELPRRRPLPAPVQGEPIGLALVPDEEGDRWVVAAWPQGIWAWTVNDLAPAWTVPVEGGVMAGPWRAGPFVAYADARSHKLHLLDTATGETRLQEEFLPPSAIPRSATPAVGGNLFAITTSDGDLAAYDLTTGRVAFWVPELGSFETGPAADEGRVFAWNTRRMLLAYGADARRTGQLEIRGPAFAPVAARGLVIVATEKPALAAYRGEDLAPAWELALPGPATQPPTIVGDSVVVVCDRRVTGCTIR